MALLDKYIQRFQELRKKHFGIEISKQQTQVELLQLFNLMRLVYKSITKEAFRHFAGNE